MSQLRKEMASRGARGIAGIGRRFKIADDNMNGSLCMDEFKKAMQECAIDLSEQVRTSHFIEFVHLMRVMFCFRTVDNYLTTSMSRKVETLTTKNFSSHFE